MFLKTHFTSLTHSPQHLDLSLLHFIAAGGIYFLKILPICTVMHFLSSNISYMFWLLLKNPFQIYLIENHLLNEVRFTKPTQLLCRLFMDPPPPSIFKIVVLKLLKYFVNKIFKLYYEIICHTE